MFGEVYLCRFPYTDGVGSKPDEVVSPSQVERAEGGDLRPEEMGVRHETEGACGLARRGVRKSE
jgi:hypothetical protein